MFRRYRIPAALVRGGLLAVAAATVGLLSATGSGAPPAAAANVGAPLAANGGALPVADAECDYTPSRFRYRRQEGNKVRLTWSINADCPADYFRISIRPDTGDGEFNTHRSYLVHSQSNPEKETTYVLKGVRDGVDSAMGRSIKVPGKEPCVHLPRRFNNDPQNGAIRLTWSYRSDCRADSYIVLRITDDASSPDDQVEISGATTYLDRTAPATGPLSYRLISVRNGKQSKQRLQTTVRSGGQSNSESPPGNSEEPPASSEEPPGNRGEPLAGKPGCDHTPRRFRRASPQDDSSRINLTWDVNEDCPAQYYTVEYLPDRGRWELLTTYGNSLQHTNPRPEAGSRYILNSYRDGKRGSAQSITVPPQAPSRSGEPPSDGMVSRPEPTLICHYRLGGTTRQIAGLSVCSLAEIKAALGWTN